MNNKVKWVAVTTVIEPAILYPLLNTQYLHSELSPIDSVLSQMKCAALGLNRNFPWAILHGSHCLGGIGIPSLCQKNTKDRISYFLYNLRRESSVREKLEISIIYTQLEVGSLQHYLTLPYNLYGHLPMIVACVQIWRDTEPYGLHLRPAAHITWTPAPLSSNDLSLRDIAIWKYNKRGSSMINRCRLYTYKLSHWLTF